MAAIILNNTSVNFVFLNIKALRGNNNNICVNNNQNSSRARIPSINLLSFSRVYKSWSRFHDLLKSLVHDDNELTNVEKLYHLKDCLNGEAADILTSLYISSENYIVARKLFKTWYDNRKVIKRSMQKHC